MAIAAIHPELIDVDIVLKMDGLDRLVSDSSVFWGEIVGDPSRDGGSQDGDADENLEREMIRPAREDIGHTY